MSQEREKKVNTSRRWVGCPIEADYFGEDRKQGKIDRKLASAKDRSKYKKTDQNKRVKQEDQASEHLLRGRILSITPQGIVLEYEGERLSCSLKGSLKKEKNQLKNLVAVGDIVRFQKVTQGEGIISYVEPRQSILSRADNLSRRKEQVIAANVDQVLITMSVVFPTLKPTLVDRYIIAAKKGHMHPVVLINKIDLLQNSSEKSVEIEQDREIFKEMIAAYQQAGVELIPISVVTGEGLNRLKEVMQGKTSVFAGQSGVGKSSLINAVAGIQLRVGDVVDRTKKGSHTTTTANLLVLPFGGWCVDTPGIKSFGVWDLKQDEIASYFQEIFSVGKNCKFPNCTHTVEEDCAVKHALEEGSISPLRYNSYVYLFEETAKEHKRR